MRISTTFTVLALVSLLSACSSEQIYSSLQDNARDNCNRMSDTDRAACLSRTSASYDNYKKQRDQATGAPHN